MSAQDTTNEETALLPQSAQKKRTPLPLGQFAIVLFLQLAEPLSSQVIYPFTPQLIREIGVTHGDEARVGYYVGLMYSLFFVAQAFTVMHWAKLSDRVGRRVVLLIGLSGISVAMFCFGLSKTFTSLVVSRCLQGALNGNIGVIKSIVFDLTDSTNIAAAYGLMPLSWTTGSTIGPMIGGLLSNPAKQYPEIFGDSAFFTYFPYFLPCAVPGTFACVAAVTTYFYLKETVPNPVPLFGRRKKEDIEGISDAPAPAAQASFLTLATQRKVVVAAANYASLSLIDIGWRSLFPVFLSTPIVNGGLGLDPSKIGNILALSGIANGFFQFFLFAKLHDRFGSKRMFTSGIVAGLVIFACFPIINIIARDQGFSLLVWGVIIVLIFASLLTSLSFGSIFIYINASAPNKESVGATNGFAQLSVSIMRAIGPSLANSLFSASMEKNLMGGYFVYYVMMGVTTLGVGVASLLPQTV